MAFIKHKDNHKVSFPRNSQHLELILTLTIKVKFELYGVRATVSSSPWDDERPTDGYSKVVAFYSGWYLNHGNWWSDTTNPGGK